eukprot:m51a1_g8070 putative actin (97) ;mRNA; r:168988-169278
MASECEVQAVVIDMGSLACKAGFAGDDAPRATVATVVGRPTGSAQGRGRSACVGNDAQRAEGRGEALEVVHAMEQGVVADWDAMEAVLQQHAPAAR